MRKQSTTPSGRSVLLVDDNPEYLASSARVLARDGHEVLTAANAPQALALLRSRRVDLVLVDYFMPGMTGEQFVVELRTSDPYVQVILQTGYAGERPPREMLRRLDIQGYHDKNEGPDKLCLWVDVGLRAASTVQLLHKSRQGLAHVLDAALALHKIQPLEDLLQDVLLQTVGLLGAVDPSLAVGPPQAQAPDGFVALDERGELQIRAGTGKFSPCAGAPMPPWVPPLLLADRIATLNDGTVVPLRVGSVPLGVIYLDRPVALEHNAELLRLFASQAAVAIHNASRARC